MSVQIGEIIEGKVTDIMKYGAFVKLDNGENGLVHISEVSKDYVENIHTVLNPGDTVKVKVTGIDENGKIALSIRKALPKEKKSQEKQQEKGQTVSVSKFDDMLSKFLKDSDERQLNLKKNVDSKRGVSRRR